MKSTYEKIQKLLSLANSANENEAKAAAKKASELLVKYNLSVQDIEIKEYENQVLSERTRAVSEEKYILSLLTKYFFVQTYFNRSRKSKTTTCKVVGTPENLEIAHYVYDFLLRSFRNSFKEYRKLSGCDLDARQSYYFGLHEGLKEQFELAKTAVQNETGLVVTKDLGLVRYLNKEVGGLRNTSSSVNSSNASARSAGRDAGKSMSIRKGVGSGSTNSGNLLG